MNEKIPQAEVDLLSAAINRIIKTEVVEKDVSGKLPKTIDLPNSNRVYTGKVSMMFVDMRRSSLLSEQFDTDQITKIYRSYIRVIVQAVRYSFGVVRDFMGDGVLAVFIDDENGKAEDKAVYAARYITTAIDKYLNPVLDNELNYRISCGIGIHSGEVSLSKVGMKGKEQDDDSENEFGIAWIGNSTNLACKQSAVVECGTIFISTSTFSCISDTNKKSVWKAISLQKGELVLRGYIAEHYYLSLDEDIKPCVAAGSSEPVGILPMLKEKINELSIQSEELGKLKLSLEEQKIELNRKTSELDYKEDLLDERTKLLNNSVYSFYCKVLSSGYCKSAYVKAMGQSFWEDYLKLAITAGEKIGKNEHKVKQEVSYAMVSIYQDLEIFDKAYDFLVEQATGYSWLILSVVQSIVIQVGYCERLKDALYVRLNKGDLSYDNQKEFEHIKDWLVFEYRR